MSDALLQPLRANLADWKAYQAQCEQELQESFAALDAMQRHLEAWQIGLTEGRKKLAKDQAALARERKSQATQLSDAKLAEAESRIQELEQQLQQQQLEQKQQNEHWSEKFSGVLTQLEACQQASQPSSAASVSCSDDLVLGSVVAQFDKIRKQRALRDS